MEETEVNCSKSSDKEDLENRLGKCEVCAVNEAKYTCPKCEVKTCQLACLKIHKKELECDGIRDKTKYIPLKKMTPMDFMSDYNFLEECTRYVQTRKRDKLKYITRFERELPSALYKLRSACRHRKTYLRFLLPHFTRHKANTTKLDVKSQDILWKIEWNFLCDGKSAVFTDDACNENDKLSTFLWKYLDPKSDIPALEYYQAKGIDGISVLLKAEGVRKCQHRFYELDVRESLRKCLENKTIVEFPIIFVISSDLIREFDLIDEDEDLEVDKKLYHNLFNVNGPNLLNRPNGPVRNQAVEKELENVHLEKQKADRKRKLDELESEQRNLLFTDESYWDALSGSEEED